MSDDVASVMRGAADDLVNQGSYAAAASVISVARGRHPGDMATPGSVREGSGHRISGSADRWLQKSRQGVEFEEKWGPGGASVRTIVLELEAALGDIRERLRLTTDELAEEQSFTAALQDQLAELSRGNEQGHRSLDELTRERAAELQIVREMETALDEAQRNATQVHLEHEQDIARLEVEIRHLKDEQGGLSTTLESETLSYQKKAALAADLEARLLVAERANSTLRAEAQRSEVSMERARIATVSAKQELATLAEAGRNMQAQNAVLLENEERLSAEVAQISSQLLELQSLDGTHQHLLADHRSLKAELEALRHENSRLDGQATRAELRLAELQSPMAERTTVAERLREENERLRADVAQLGGSAKRSEAQKNELSTSYEECKATLAAQRRQHEQAVRSHEAECQQHQEALRTMEEQAGARSASLQERVRELEVMLAGGEQQLQTALGALEASERGRGEKDSAVWLGSTAAQAAADAPIRWALPPAQATVTSV